MTNQTHRSNEDKKSSLHDTFSHLFQEVENQWTASVGSDTPPELNISETAQAIVAILRAQPWARAKSHANAAERAQQNLANFFENESLSTKDRDDGMTTGEAADYLRMSRNTLKKMLVNGDLTFRTWMVGSHMRLSREDVLAYWDRLMSKDRDPIKSELVKLSEEARMYDYSSKDD